MKKNKNYYINLIYLFIIISILGYIWELLYFSIKEHNIINRGFLRGPYLPIYGFCAIFMVILIKKDKNKVITYLKCLIFASIVEYLTSYILELIFHHKWWDYQYEPFNINGRITLMNSIIFGVIGFITITYFYPFLEKHLNKIPIKIKTIISIIIVLIVLTDFIYSTINPHIGYLIT